MASTTPSDGSVVVWGNCQAEPIAKLLDGPLARHGLHIVWLPPVYLINQEDLNHAHRALAGARYLISQPIADDYRLSGCGTDQLAAHLGPAGTLVRFPVMFHTGAYPYQVNAHGGDGDRVNAPLTDYHDLRAVVAAERGLDVAQALRWWPEPPAGAVERLAATSLDTLRRRESGTDVRVAELVDAPEAMWTITHPTNRTLARTAEAILRALGLDAPVAAPEREFLGARRAPLEPAVLRARGWATGSSRPDWTIDGRRIGLEAVLAQQLPFYRERPDIVVDCRTRYADRLHALDL